MALGKKYSSMKTKRGAVNNGDEELGLGFVRFTRGLGGKRIVISNDKDNESSLKRQRSESIFIGQTDKSTTSLESLPQDILIRILCGVEHQDLKQLFHVSKPIREATLIAKQWHFAYSTPTKARRVFRTKIDEFDEIEAPNAPKQRRGYKSRINGKSLADISVALFS